MCASSELLCVVGCEFTQMLIGATRKCSHIQTLVMVIRGLVWLCEHAAHKLHQQIAQLLLHVPIHLIESNASASVQQLAFDCLGSIAHIPGFLPELYLNYDCCGVSQECLLERLMGTLHKGIFPVTLGSLCCSRAIRS